jgi:hypothetical protein
MSETVELPRDALGEHVREQIKLDSEIQEHTRDGVDIDTWEHIDTATLKDLRWEDDDLHAWFESETTVSERVARATRHHPAEYRNHDADVLIGVVWDFDPESQPIVDIEVVKR